MNDAGFESIFKESAKRVAEAGDLEQLYRSFRNPHGPFDFTHCGTYNKPDLEALGSASLINATLMATYLHSPKPMLGYEGFEDTYLPIDIVDSRHVMMSTLLFHSLKRVTGNVVELGGGFGNWARLNHFARSHCAIDFSSWTIVDLPHVSALQRWYLNELGVRGVEFVTTEEFQGWLNARFEPIDLVIAAHSLSELSADNFIRYFDELLMRTRYLFYATHMFHPDPALVDLKLKVIGEHFDVVDELSTEGGYVLNRVYKRRT